MTVSSRLRPSANTRIRAAYELHKAGIPHCQVAKQAGVSRPFISRILAGRDPCPDYIKVIIKRLLAEAAADESDPLFGAA